METQPYVEVYQMVSQVSIPLRGNRLWKRWVDAYQSLFEIAFQSPCGGIGCGNPT
ncbi:hypothetical protein FDUTEX481_08588 [Tolypothrix sp. PCC 7601]|nr:hypothetical protein FDUTEX481_08588 [Tolypothrix sp. PCC 7601]